MDAAQAGRSRLSPRHALAGLESGVLGALVMLGFLMVASAFNQRSVWLVPNLFATMFFGNDAYRDGFAHGSLAGASLFIAIYGLLGLVWGCAWRDSGNRWLPLGGAAVGIAVYLLFFDFVWKHASPLIMLYAPDRQLQIGHVVWGVILAQSPRFARRIACSTAAEAPEPLDATALLS